MENTFEKIIGKEIAKVDEVADSVLVITFSDGTIIEISSNGYEDHWLSVYIGD